MLLTLFVLIFANIIISSAHINGELNYELIKLFYNFIVVILFVISCVFAVMFLSNSLYQLYERNIITHLLSVKINLSSIIYAVYIMGVANVVIILFSAFPIISVSFYFGGFGIVKIIRLLSIIISFAIFISTLCLFISTKFKNNIKSIVISVFLCNIFGCVNLFTLNYIIFNTFRCIIYVLISLIISLILLTSSSRNNVFNE